ncbi:cytochrome P450 [Trichoderma velutinum]
MMVNIVLIAIAGIIAAGYLLYRKALPKPLSDIPFKAESAERLMGDVPDLVADVSRRKNINLWWRDHCASFNSPICQVFLGGPFSKPIVILTDYREARDIETRRTKEFDRSERTKDMFGPLAPSFQFVLKSDANWKAHRNLVQDLVSRQFLEEVAAPTLYDAAARLVELWSKKIALSNGRPFSATTDIFNVTYDAVLSFFFGSEFPNSATQPRIDLMKTYRLPENEKKVSREEPMEFPDAKLPDELESIHTLLGFAEGALKSGLPKWYWFFQTRSAKFKRAKKTKDACFKTAILNATDKRLKHLKGGDASDRSWINSSIDHLIDRECKIADIEGRRVDIFSDMIMDEVLGMVAAGHDSTSSTLCWAVKYLADHQDVQQRLRKSMHVGYGKAFSEGHTPTTADITNISIPYADAVMEEILRLSTVVPFGSRQATQDTMVLGRRIPKGTVVIYLKNGPGFLTKGYDIDENTRSETSKQEKDRVSCHSQIPLDEFRPERWIKISTEGHEVYDPNAAPMSTFGLGPRACFGKRLAYLEFRLLLTMIIWNFELQKCPEELSSYDGRYKAFVMPWKCYVRLEKITH